MTAITTQFTTNQVSAQHSNISEPHAHDVLCGRGAGITKHAGNRRWRELIGRNRQRYTALPRNQRPIIAETIVKAVRSLNPPGRFLAKDAATQLWYDIGDERATEKTAQAMRDSKKNGKDSTSSTPAVSPAVSPSSSPKPKKAIAIASNVSCSPLIARPSMMRGNTDDSFCQRMEGFTFESPLLERDPSAILCGTDMRSKCSPDIAKPFMFRKSTFDKRLDAINFSTLTPLPARADSMFSMASFDMLAEDELELLEQSCGMPAQQQPHMPSHSQPHFDFAAIQHHLRVESDGDAIMEDSAPTNYPSRWSV